MQTSTSIHDLKRTTKQNTDDLVNDILKELQTTPSLNVTSNSPAPSNSVNDFESVLTSSSETENKKEEKSTNEYVKEYLQKLKLPLGIVLVYFLFHNNVFDSSIEQFAPVFMRYEASFVNKLFKAILVSLCITLLHWFA